MDTGSNIFKFLKWLRREILQDVISKLHDLDEKLKQQEKDTAELNKICKELLQAVSKLEGKYENVGEAVYHKVINKLLDGRNKIQQKEIIKLEHQLKNHSNSE